MQQYEKLINDVNYMQIEVDSKNNHMALVWGAENGRPGSLVDECSISMLIKAVRDITGQALNPSQVDFINAKPTDITPYEQFFNCSVSFEQPYSRIIFPSIWINLPLHKSDQVLQQLLTTQVDQLLEQLPQEAPLIEAVKKYIATAGAGKNSQANQAAKSLSMTERTLHRRLYALGTSYSKIRENVLTQIAIDYLKDSRLTLTEISFLMGFSEQSAFSRAFKKWTNTSPLVWRAQHTNNMRSIEG
jgi:AraC-like DNA-binding protein